MPASVQFDAPNLLAVLEAVPADQLDELDELDFGVIVMDRSGVVVHYNKAESELSGLSPERVVGQQFFEAVGPCTNNYLVAQRYLDEPDLDDSVDYVFTFRMAPTPVQLRLLARAGSARQYLVVRRR